MADMAREWYPEREDRITLGKPGNYTYKDPGVYTLLNDKSKKELGITCELLLDDRVAGPFLIHRSTKDRDFQGCDG
jgi:hypothetical protein